MEPNCTSFYTQALGQNARLFFARTRVRGARAKVIAGRLPAKLAKAKYDKDLA